MSSATHISRRKFLRDTARAGGALTIAFHLPGFGLDAALAAELPGPLAPNAFLRMDRTGGITVMVNKSEMGQGVYTSLPMILAEELDADWTKVRFESAPVAPEYNHTVFGMQATGGSTSVSTSFEQFRKAGAMGRALMLAAAAAEWGVEPAACRTENSFVIHDASSRRVPYGQLVERARSLPAPKDVPLKEPQQFKLIGKPTKRLDSPEKVNGSAVFGLDVKLPGMLTAVIARAPVFGGKVKSVNDAKARAVPGVKQVVALGHGVVVAAEGYWAARKGRDALEVQWEEGPGASISTAAMRRQYTELARTPGLPARNDGDAAAALAAAAKKLEAVYEVPYLAHAPMEPLNCTVDLRADGCEIWTGTQFQTVDRAVAAAVAGLKPEQVQIHTTFLGGGFGRRANPAADFVGEAVQVARALKAPVKVIWTREDDMRGGYFRPMYVHAVRAALGAEGAPVAWLQRIVGQSIVAGTPFEGMLVQNGIDGTSVEGAADMPYAIPNLRVELHTTRIGVPVLWWRSVGHSHTAFVVESFLDELAHASGKDPLALRRALLAKHPRHLGVLELAAEKAGWGKPLPAGRARGLAVHYSFESYVAHVAEVTVGKDGRVQVHRVTTAVDCGQVVNPETVRAQMEGAIVFAMSAAFYGEITLENGRVQQGNFHNYRMARIPETPQIDVHIVNSTERPTGIGEPGVPPLAPAISNAIFAATGKRLRRLPIRPEDLSKA